jgi:hypothetical protein
LKFGYHCTKKKTEIEEGKLGAYSPSFLGAALGADHRAESQREGLSIRKEFGKFG